MKWIKASEKQPLHYKPTEVLHLNILNDKGLKMPWIGTFDKRENAFYPDNIGPIGPKEFHLVEWLDDTEIDMTKVTRFEVINHKDNHNQFGRSFTDYEVNTIELDFQDNNRTLKVFLT